MTQPTTTQPTDRPVASRVWAAMEADPFHVPTPADMAAMVRERGALAPPVGTVWGLWYVDADGRPSLCEFDGCCAYVCGLTAKAALAQAPEGMAGYIALPVPAGIACCVDEREVQAGGLSAEWECYMEGEFVQVRLPCVPVEGIEATAPVEANGPAPSVEATTPKAAPVYHPQAVRALRVYQGAAKERLARVPDVEASEDYAAAVEFASSEPGASAPVEATRRYVASNRRNLLAKCRAARAMMRGGAWQGEGPSLDLAAAQGALWRIREERRAFLSAMARAGAVEAPPAPVMVEQPSQPQQGQDVRRGMARCEAAGEWQVGMWNVARQPGGQWEARATGPGTIGDGSPSLYPSLGAAYLALTGEAMPGAPAMVPQLCQQAQARDARIPVEGRRPGVRIEFTCRFEGQTETFVEVIEGRNYDDAMERLFDIDTADHFEIVSERELPLA